MKREVRVSIVSANYNNEIYLDDFFHSIINSTVTPSELIVVEDGSHDQSRKVIETYRYLGFLKVIQHDENKGLAISLNEGVNVATRTR